MVNRLSERTVLGPKVDGLLITMLPGLVMIPKKCENLPNLKKILPEARFVFDSV